MAKKKINSRAKGKVGELQFRDFLREKGISARRGQQFSGSPDSPDVKTEIDHLVHFEVKRTETLSVYKALKQAQDDSKETQIPVVAHRRNHKDWLIILPADKFIDLILKAYPLPKDAECTF